MTAPSTSPTRKPSTWCPFRLPQNRILIPYAGGPLPHAPHGDVRLLLRRQRHERPPVAQQPHEGLGVVEVPAGLEQREGAEGLWQPPGRCTSYQVQHRRAGLKRGGKHPSGTGYLGATPDEQPMEQGIMHPSSQPAGTSPRDQAHLVVLVEAREDEPEAAHAVQDAVQVLPLEAQRLLPRQPALGPRPAHARPAGPRARPARAEAAAAAGTVPAVVVGQQAQQQRLVAAVLWTEGGGGGPKVC